MYILVGKFHLSYESRKPTNAGIKINTATDDFWNTICSFYSSDRDETPAEGMLNANIDVQKYYNPAKKKLLPELRKVRDYFRAEKKIFREKLQALGFE